MENWGLITFRESEILFDESSSVQAKQEIANTISHELCHQWFGNIVTMMWWNDLWLNEAFATFLGWLAVDHLFPEWNVWTQFLSNNYSQALALDALRSSHPIDVQVNSPNEIGEIFDAICYHKGASILKMLYNFLGSKVFMDGVRSYIQEFKWKNTVGDDLWCHFSLASEIDISNLMYSWTRETGYPLVKVESESFDAFSATMTVKLSQSRFLSGGDLQEDEDQVLWWIPITVVTHLNPHTPLRHILVDKSAIITFPYSEESGAYWKLNYDATGIYRVKYPSEQVYKIADVVSNDPTIFSPGDRLMMVSDMFFLMTAGLESITTFLEMILALENEEDGIVLEQISQRLDMLKNSCYSESEVTRNGIDKLTLKIFGSKVAKVGFDFSENEDHLDSMKRTLIITKTFTAGDKRVVAELCSRFHKFIAGDTSALHPNIRPVAYSAFLSVSTPESAESDFQILINLYNNPNTPAHEKEIILESFGAITTPAIINRILETLIFDPDFLHAQQSFFSPLFGLKRWNRHQHYIRPLLWEWLTRNWDRIYARFTVAIGKIGVLLSVCLSGNIDPGFEAQVQEWITGDEIREEQLKLAERNIAHALEGNRTAAKWILRERDNLAKWVSNI
ncbi:Aminopeptidase 2 mitochondrial [Physocladia obscura]|uniref:Aminopeptidase 2 mitochondrial n=1 Tax=Physocladia obscura TaxID=109957 RepID=A0AAD5ST02_9FUNG|nr:Aminopeptidase 2 mitochondrial [Physocladia obscura]